MIDMNMDMQTLTGEATAYDKKQMLEVKRPKSWLKSVSAFANGEGGTLIFGVSDDDQIVGLSDAESDAEKISEEIKSKLDPVPAVNLEYKELDGKKLVLLQVYPGQETPYYYIGDKQRLAFIRVGNESVTADRIQLKSLVLKGSDRISFDGPPIGAYGLCMGWEPRVFLGTLGVFFVIRGSFTVILQATAGFYTPEVLGYALYGAPGVILGTLLAFPVAKRIPQETFRKVLLVIIGVAGAVCLVRAFL